MRCEDLHDQLIAYLDGELPEDTAAACEAHLAVCETCAAEIAARQQERDRWRDALRESAPADLRHEILAGRAPRRTISFERRHAGRKSMWTAWAAAAVLALIVLGQVVTRLGTGDEPNAAIEAFARPGAVALVVDGEIIGAFAELETESLVLDGGFL